MTGEPYDVFIVGGGVAGTALLYELAAFTSQYVHLKSYIVNSMLSHE